MLAQYAARHCMTERGVARPLLRQHLHPIKQNASTICCFGRVRTTAASGAALPLGTSPAAAALPATIGCRWLASTTLT